MRHSLPREIRRIRKIYKIRRHPCRFRYHTVETVRFSANFQRHLRKHPASFPLENYSITKEFRGQKNSFFYPNYKKNIKIEREAGKILESIKIEDQFAFTLYLRVNLETHFSLLSTRLKKKKKEKRNSKRAYFNLLFHYLARKSQTRLLLLLFLSPSRQKRYDEHSYYLAPSIHQLSFPNSRPFKLFQEGVY